MNYEQEINYDGTDDPVCPHCGKVYEDFFNEELNGDPVFDGTADEVECPHCGKEYEYSVCVNISYHTSKIEELEDEE